MPTQSGLICPPLQFPFAGKDWNDFHWTNPTSPGDCWANYGDHLTMPLESPTDPGAHSLRNLFWSAYDGVPSADENLPVGKPPGFPPWNGTWKRSSGPPPDSGNRVLGAALKTTDAGLELKAFMRPVTPYASVGLVFRFGTFSFIQLLAINTFSLCGRKSKPTLICYKRWNSAIGALRPQKIFTARY